MKKVLVTGGTDGIGKGLVLSYLMDGYQVISVGSSHKKGRQLIKDADNMNKGDNLIFIQADLSLVRENLRLVKEVSEKFDSLDILVLCAASLELQKSYVETKEGFEFTFALYYLSRYVLGNQLQTLMEKSDKPVIINVCAPGMSGKINWDDIQMKQKYNGLKAQFQGSRLNDLLAVAYHEKDVEQKVRYILFNPMAARTSGAVKMGKGNPAMSICMKLYYKLMGKDVEEITAMIRELSQKQTISGLAAYKLKQPVDMGMETFDKSSAWRLEQYTQNLLEKFFQEWINNE